MLSRLLLLILSINICLISTQKEIFLENLQELAEMTPEEVELLFKTEAEISMQAVGGIIPMDCINELKNLKSVFVAIKDAGIVDEKIFYGTKAIVNNFPGLKAKCGIPLPTVDTSKWTIDQFKKVKCTVVICSFSITASTCLGGAIFQCPGAISLLKDTANCIKQLIA